MFDLTLDLKLDSSSFEGLTDQIKEIVQSKVNAAAEALAVQCYGKITEMASEQLHSTKNKYIENLTMEKVSEGHWKVSLAKPALFIEEGMEAHSMIEDLLKNGAKVSKSGNRYRAIPFNHSALPQNQTQKQKDITSLLKSSMKSQGIPWSKIEKDASGSAKLGKLHSFDVESPRPSAAASHPALEGVNIYQTKTASGNVRRDAMTFRMVSDSQKGQKWNHPGLAPKKFFEKAFEEAKTTWENEILPNILKA